jgi:hypothetical protein
VLISFDMGCRGKDEGDVGRDRAVGTICKIATARLSPECAMPLGTTDDYVPGDGTVFHGQRRLGTDL